MRTIFLLLITTIFVNQIVFAQKTFDSIAYTKFYTDRWEKVNFEDFMAERPLKVLTAEEKIAGLSKAWAEVKYNFANFDLVPNLNWDSLYVAYIPKVTATTNVIDYYKVLQNFYQPLRDGHTGISFPGAYMKNEWNGALPIEVRWIKDKAIVVTNTSNKPGEKDIMSGAELVEWNGVPLQEHIKKNISPYLNFSTSQDSIARTYGFALTTGKAGSTVPLIFKTPEGKTLKQEMTYKAVERFWDRNPLVTFEILEGNIGYLQINSFNDEIVVNKFDSLFSSIAKTNALIIDVRKNGGGNGNNGFEILGSLTDKPFYPGKAVIREYKSVGRAWGQPESVEIESWDWKPYKNQLYTKPVIVLTSAATYSAAEDFTATFQSMERGIVIGEPTGGSTGQPVMFTLPGGGMGRVCAKRDMYADGKEFIGIGIMPDLLVRPTLKGIVAGRDDVLEAAVNYLTREL